MFFALVAYSLLSRQLGFVVSKGESLLQYSTHQSGFQGSVILRADLFHCSKCFLTLYFTHAVGCKELTLNH